MKFLKNKNLIVALTFLTSMANVLSQKAFAETKEVNLTEPILEKQIETEEYLYTKNFKTSIFDSPQKIERFDILQKSTRVSILERKEVEVIDKIKVKHKTSSEEKPKVEIVEKKRIENWVHVKYRKNLKAREGWALEKQFISNPLENLPNSWEGLEVSNFPEKKEFEDNPRIDVKGVYLTVYSASYEKKLNALIKLAKETEINTFVIDVKDDGGQLLWKMDDSILKYNKKAFSKTYIKDINAFMKRLKDNNIYTIARIVSFKDPSYAKQNPDKAIIEKKSGKPFTNKDGVIWVSPHDKNLWEYNIKIAKEAAKVGFNEIQFDYVRFPASNGGKLDKFLDYRNPNNDSKPVTIQKYLKYAWKELTPLHVYINADIYGQIGTFKDDMGLGQYWEALSGYTHYLSPMMYPSHYRKGAYGVPIPDAEPYKIIYKTTIDSINRNENINNPAMIRPWLQDFTARWIKGHITYTDKEIREQIRALNDLGIHQYLLWSASNRYHIK